MESCPRLTRAMEELGDVRSLQVLDGAKGSKNGLENEREKDKMETIKRV